MQRRQAGQGLTLRERALAARDARRAQFQRNAAESFARQRERQRLMVGAIQTPTNSNDDMKDNEIGPKRPRFIDSSNLTLPNLSDSAQSQIPNNMIPLSAIEYHNQIVRRRNANITRVLNDIQNVAITNAMQLPPGRAGLFINNFDRNIAQALNLRTGRSFDNDEKRN